MSILTVLMVPLLVISLAAASLLSARAVKATPTQAVAYRTVAQVYLKEINTDNQAATTAKAKVAVTQLVQAQNLLDEIESLTGEATSLTAGLRGPVLVSQGAGTLNQLQSLRQQAGQDLLQLEHLPAS